MVSEWKNRFPSFSAPPARVRWLSALLFLVGSTLLAAHVYRYPVYDIDMLGYMGNALLMEKTDVVDIHSAVYAEVRKLPLGDQEHLTMSPSGPGSPKASRMDRTVNPYHFAEFLPFFAIRPGYNYTLHCLHRLGFGFAKASVLISVVSFFCLGFIAFQWLAAYVFPPYAALLTLLTLASPALLTLAQTTTPDALSTLITFASLYLLFAERREFLGILLLLLSPFLRTDNLVLVLLVLAVLALRSRLSPLQAGVLALVAVASVLAINHFSGNYGMRTLYYHVFHEILTAPAEFVPPPITVRDYLSIMRRAFTQIVQGHMIPFALLGAIGLIGSQVGALRVTVLSAALYVVLHLVSFPLVQDRYFGIFYLSAALAGASIVRSGLSEPASG